MLLLVKKRHLSRILTQTSLRSIFSLFSHFTEFYGISSFLTEFGQNKAKIGQITPFLGVFGHFLDDFT